MPSEPDSGESSENQDNNFETPELPTEPIEPLEPVEPEEPAETEPSEQPNTELSKIQVTVIIIMYRQKKFLQNQQRNLLKIPPGKFRQHRYRGNSKDEANTEANHSTAGNGPKKLYRYDYGDILEGITFKKKTFKMTFLH